MKTSKPIGPWSRMRARIASAAAVCTVAVWRRPARMAPDGRATHPSRRLGGLRPARTDGLRGARRATELGEPVPSGLHRVPRRGRRRGGRSASGSLVQRRGTRAPCGCGARARRGGRPGPDRRGARRVRGPGALRRRATERRPDLAAVPLGRPPGGPGALRRAVLHDRGQRRRVACRRWGDRADVVGRSARAAQGVAARRAQALLANLVHGHPGGGVPHGRRGDGAQLRVARSHGRRRGDDAAARDGAGLMLRVTRVLAPNPSVYKLEGTNTWVVGAGPSIVIDPGPPDRDHVAQVREDAGEVAVVLVTHDHEDHGEGAVAFGGLVGAPVYAWRLEGTTRLTDGARFTAGGGVELVAVHGAGHSPDHVAFFEPTERALFTGDTVVGRGTSFIDPPEGDLARYLTTLHRMLELHPR